MAQNDSFEPQDDETTLHIYCGGNSGGYAYNFSELIERIENHFGKDISLNDLDISAERFHTRCIHYDLYDAWDYDNYIIITRK